MKDKSFSSLIWLSADALSGVFSPSEYGRIILPFIFLRRLDCVLEHVKDDMYSLYEQHKNTIDDPSPIIENEIGFPFYNHSRFDLIRLKGDPDNIENNFNDYLHGYSLNVLDIIQNFSLEPFVRKLSDWNRLHQLVNKISEINLHPSIVDNDRMASFYEDLICQFYGTSKSERNEHYTPRDVTKLQVALVFSGTAEGIKSEGKALSIYDPCCGTGGMLTAGKEWVLKNATTFPGINLFGQEIDCVTHSICRSKILMMGENLENIHGPRSSLSDDRLPNKLFDYMLTIPPFRFNWSSEKAQILQEYDNPNGRFQFGIPRVSDGSFLFLQHLIQKMNPDGARIGILFNGSPLFAGDAGSGESEIRKRIIENDWLESIVRLPDQLFVNVGITTYIWIVTNRKIDERKGKVQLIDASSCYQSMKKSLGQKRKEITDSHCRDLARIYASFAECEHSMIVPNNFFGYRKITIEQPNYDKNGKVITEIDGKPKPDTEKRCYERVPLSRSVEDYFTTEVKPRLPDSWIDRSRDKVGYEINFSWVIEKSISKLTTDYVQYPTVQLKNISTKLNFTQSEFEHLEGAVYIPLIGNTNCESNLEGVKKNHRNFCQVFLDQNRVRERYLLQYLNSLLGQKILQLAQSESGSRVIPQIRRDKVGTLNIALPPIETQKQIEEATDKLDRVSESITLLRQNLSLNPITSEAELKQLDRIVGAIEEWTAADEIKKLARSGESKYLEFKETLSWNVKSEQKDKILEFAVIKSVAAFLNTEGGNVLVGVDDSGRIKGLDYEIRKLHKNCKDRFLRHIDNLLRDRIGVHFSQFYGTRLVKVEDAIVLRISCDKSNRQVFVNRDEFYVRTSPATHQLHGQDVIDYVNMRF